MICKELGWTTLQQFLIWYAEFPWTHFLQHSISGLIYSVNFITH